MIDSLFDSPQRFDFVQAVRLLERWIAMGQVRALSDAPAASDYEPVRRFEHLRFRSSPSLAYPEGEIAEIVPDQELRRIDVMVRFMGLAGFSGALPLAYTSLAASEAKSRRDGLNDFLDLFHDRLIRLYYDAWAKHSLPVAYERGGGRGGDAATTLLRSLIGDPSPPGTQPAPTHAGLALYFGGEFSRHARSAGGLARILRDALGLDIEIEELVGVWLPLAEEDQSRLSGDGHASGVGMKLNGDALVGRHVWEIEGTFRVVVRHLTYNDYRQLFPGAAGAIRLRSLVRVFVPAHLQCLLKLELAPGEVPILRLTSNEHGLQLSLNSWLTLDVQGVETTDIQFLL